MPLSARDDERAYRPGRVPLAACPRHGFPQQLADLRSRPNLSAPRHDCAARRNLGALLEHAEPPMLGGDLCPRSRAMMRSPCTSQRTLRNTETLRRPSCVRVALIRRSLVEHHADARSGRPVPSSRPYCWSVTGLVLVCDWSGSVIASRLLTATETKMSRPPPG